MTDGVRIDIRGDAAGFKRAAQEAALELNKLQESGEQVAEATKRQRAEAEKYLVNLQKEAVLLGQGEAARRRLEVQMLNITEGQRQQALAVIDNIEAYRQAEAGQERMAAAGRRMGLAVGTAAVAAAAAIAKIVYESVQAAPAAEQIDAKLTAVLRATGQAAGLARGEIGALAQAMKGAAGIDDDKIKSAAAVMLTYRNVQGETFKEGIKLAADLSAVMGSDLASATQQLGRALNDPEQALGALTRAGVQFSHSQQKMIKDFVETGQLGRAQAIIIEELKNKLGGAAEAMNTGYTKATNELKNSWDDLLKTIGGTDAVKSTTVSALGAISGWLANIKASIEHGDWADKLMAITGMRGLIGAPVAAARAAGPSRAQDALDWAAGLGDIRDPRDIRAGAQYGQVMQQAQQIADAENRFLDKFKTNHEKMDEEIGKARTILGKYPELLGKVVAAIREKYKPAKSDLDRMRELGRKNELDAYYETGGEETMRLVAEKRERGAAARDYQEGQADWKNWRREMAGAIAEEEKHAEALGKENEKLKEQIDTLGLSATEIADYKARKIEAAAASAELAAKSLDDAAALLEEQKVLPEVASGYRRLAEAKRQAAGRAAEQAGLTRHSAEREEAVEYWRGIERAAHDAFMHIGEKGRNTWERLNDALKNTLLETLYRLTVKKWVVQIEQSVTGSGGGGAGAGGLLDGLLGRILRGGAATNLDDPARNVQGNADYYWDQHAGGIAGAGGSSLRLRDPGIFDGARRLHGGGVTGLSSDEEPVVLRRGEGVFTPEQMRALAPAAPAGSVQVIVNNNAPNTAATARETQDARGNRRIDRIPSSLEYIHAGLRSERMRRGDHAVDGFDLDILCRCRERLTQSKEHDGDNAGKTQWVTKRPNRKELSFMLLFVPTALITITLTQCCIPGRSRPEG